MTRDEAFNLAKRSIDPAVQRRVEETLDSIKDSATEGYFSTKVKFTREAVNQELIKLGYKVEVHMDAKYGKYIEIYWD